MNRPIFRVPLAKDPPASAAVFGPLRFSLLGGFFSPPPQSWPASVVARGPRSIFFVQDRASQQQRGSFSCMTWVKTWVAFCAVDQPLYRDAPKYLRQITGTALRALPNRDLPPSRHVIHREYRLNISDAPDRSSCARHLHLAPRLRRDQDARVGAAASRNTRSPAVSGLRFIDLARKSSEPHYRADKNLC